MREIKFRAKKERITKENERYLDNGWVYSSCLLDLDDGFYMLPDGISGECYYEKPYDFRANSDCFEIMVAKVKPETLGQYTGLKDKNGKEIYEGDIIKYIRTNMHEPYADFNNKDLISYRKIYWSEEEYSFYQIHYTDDKRRIGRGSIKFRDDRAKDNIIEVIGNIYDNPELLEELKND